MTRTEDLVLRHDGKTAVIFVFHHVDRNVRFFLRHGLVPHAQVDFVLVQNMPDWSDRQEDTVTEKPLGPSKVWRIQRPNCSQDWGAYGAALRHLQRERYDFFVCVNSTMRGPFLPPWYQGGQQGTAMPHWSQLFTRRLNDQVAEVGSTINPLKGHRPHVQSMAFAFDHRALRIWLAHEVLFLDNRRVPKDQLIDRHEVAKSKLLLDAGFNLDTLLTCYQGRDWRLPEQHDLPRQTDPWFKNSMFGTTVHPYETIFFKTNRFRHGHADVDLLTDFWEHAEVRQQQPEAATEASSWHSHDVLHPADEWLGPLVPYRPSPLAAYEEQAAEQRRVGAAATAATAASRSVSSAASEAGAPLPSERVVWAACTASLAALSLWLWWRARQRST